MVSVTSLMVLLNNENLSADIKTNLIKETANSEQTHEEAVAYGPFNLGEGAALLVGMDGLINFANEKFGESTDFDPADMKGQLFFNYIHPEDLAGVLSAYGKVLSSKEPQMLVGPFRMKNAAGEYTVQMAAMQPVVEENKMQGVAVMTRAISAESVPVEEIEIEYAEEVDVSDEEPPQETEETQSTQYLIDDLSEAGFAGFEEEAAEEEEEVLSEAEVETQAEVKTKVEEPAVEKNEENIKKGNSDSQKDEAKPRKKDKQIRNESDNDKRLVVDNLANLINKVYRDPDVLAYLF